MNNRDRVDRFNAKVDQILEGKQIEAGSAPTEDENLDKLVKALAGNDTQAQSQVKQMLRQRLLSRVGEADGQYQPEIETLPNRSLRRFAVLIPALAVVLILVVLAVPPVRAVAQDIIRTIGNYVINDNPTDAEEYVATLQSGTPTPTVDPDWVCTDCPEPQVVQLLTITEVSEQAGFPVYEPMYIPEGYQLAGRDVLFTGQTTTADTSYRMELDPPLHEGLQMAGIIAITQTLVYEGAQPWDMGVGDIPIVDVTVRGEAGVWLEQIPVIPVQNEEGEWEYERWNQLIWSEDGYNFMLQTNLPSDMLSLDELMKIAESLH